MAIDGTQGWLEKKIQQIQSARAGVIYPFLKKEAATFGRSPEARLAEAVGLTEAINLDVRLAETVPLSKVRPATLIGGGKIEELSKLVKEDAIEVIIVDGTLSPVQQRNLEKELNVKILDRTGLILEIFGDRARTKEGVLQVELAHLEYQKTRLVRSWTHLERQRGGLSTVGGPGETQLEIDRRLINERIGRIKKEMETVVRTRDLHRKNRERAPYPVVALVGYTNAGKSSLFNRLTGAEVMAKDMLFATLDPTMRAVALPGGQSVILSDTVGFISELPTHLVAAFRATLEEVLGADVVLIVSDRSHPDWEAQHADVVSVMQDLGIDVTADHVPVIDVYNKVDALPEEQAEALRAQDARAADTALVSALTGEGCEALLEQIAHAMKPDLYAFEVSIPVSDGALISWIYANGQVTTERVEETDMILGVEMDGRALGRLQQRAKEIVPQAILDQLSPTVEETPEEPDWRP